MKVIEINNFPDFANLYDQCLRENTEVSKEPSNNFIMLFVASDDPSTGQSWCPDCVQSKPVIDKVLEDFKFNEQLTLVSVHVGNREEWKSDQNPYINHELNISKLPTLYSLKTVSRN